MVLNNIEKISNKSKNTKNIQNLENTINETLKLSEKSKWKSQNKYIDIVRSKKDVIDIFKLRSRIYKEVGYNVEFPEEIEGLIYDDSDKRSILFLSRNENKQIVGSIKLTLDKKCKILPSEDKYLFNHIREKYNVAELGKQVIETRNRGKLTYKYLYSAVYNFAISNNIDTLVGSFKKDHLKLYRKFGGIKIEKEIKSYGNINLDFYIISWNLHKVSDFFKRGILNKR